MLLSEKRLERRPLGESEFAGQRRQGVVVGRILLVWEFLPSATFPPGSDAGPTPASTGGACSDPRRAEGHPGGRRLSDAEATGPRDRLTGITCCARFLTRSGKRLSPSRRNRQQVPKDLGHDPDTLVVGDRPAREVREKVDLERVQLDDVRLVLLERGVVREVPQGLRLTPPGSKALVSAAVAHAQRHEVGLELVVFGVLPVPFYE